MKFDQKLEDSYWDGLRRSGVEPVPVSVSVPDRAGSGEAHLKAPEYTEDEDGQTRFFKPVLVDEKTGQLSFL